MNKLDFRGADQRIQELIREKKLPNLSICVCGPEGILFEKGYGYRDKDFIHPADPDTVFGVASMSKSITALAIAILECEGKLSYDDPVHKYFPAFSVPGQPRDMVTLRTLAQHTAGIPPMEPLEWSIAMNSPRDNESDRKLRASAPNAMSTIDQVIDYIAHCPYPMVGAPGENMSYCNEGYAILSYVVDQAAGIPLEIFCQERIFGPLGMTRTIMDDNCVSAHEMAGGNISSLFEYEDDILVCDDVWSVLPPFRGCAMVKSTARDMAVYYRCLSNFGVHEGYQVLPKAAVERMIGQEIPATDLAVYGLGLYKRVKAGHVICEHAGELHGVSTRGGLLLGEGVGFAALCSLSEAENDEIIWTLYNAVIGLPLEESHRWFKPTGHVFSDLPMLKGNYISHEGIPVIADVDDAGKARISDNDVNLLYCGGGRFLGVDPEKPETVLYRLEFLFRNGQAWGVRVGSRIYTRVA